MKPKALKPVFVCPSGIPELTHAVACHRGVDCLGFEGLSFRGVKASGFRF